MTPKTPKTITSLILLTLTALLWAAPAMAEPRPSSDLLLPYFEVDLSQPGGRTTLFAIGNAAADAVTVKASVTSNWGIEMFTSSFELEAGEVRTVNLRDWLQNGKLPERKLAAGTLAHVQAALTGQPSPRDDMYYGTQPDPLATDLAVGAVTLRVTSNPRLDALWGDYFWVLPGEDSAEGELLVNIDRSMACRGLCTSHRLRFLEGGGFDGGTKLLIWSPRVGQPSPNANTLTTGTLFSASAYHTEPGAQFDERELDLLPVQMLDVRDLLLAEDFGWLDLVTDDEVYVGVRYSASQRYSVAIQSWCMPDKPCTGCGGGGSDEPAIDIEKSTNGVDADELPGPLVAPSGAVTWEYVVTNTGDVRLTDVQVTDDQEGAISCPDDTLRPGETMTCVLASQAPAEQDIPAGGFFYENLATVVGTPPTGSDVTDSDPSHYWVQEPIVTDLPTIDVEKATNGHDADAAPGPQLFQGDLVTWTYVVTNTGNVDLVNVAIVDDVEGAVTCPKTTLAVGEAMTCTLNGTALEGQYANVATVTGQSSNGQQVQDADPSHYFAEPMTIEGQGCTPGYWKNHTDSWPATGYSPSQSVQSVFASAAGYPGIGSASLIEALDFKGGSGVDGAAHNLLRAAVAGLLDASHPGVEYPRVPANLIADVNAALASGDRDTMLMLASSIDADNNLGCPLN